MPVVYTNPPIHPCPQCVSLKWISFALFILLVTFSYFSHLWGCAPFFRCQGYCFLLPTTSVGRWIAQLGRLETRVLYTSFLCLLSPPATSPNWSNTSSKDFTESYPSQSGHRLLLTTGGNWVILSMHLVGEARQNLGVIFICYLVSAWLQASWAYSWEWLFVMLVFKSPANCFCISDPESKEK